MFYHSIYSLQSFNVKQYGSTLIACLGRQTAFYQNSIKVVWLASVYAHIIPVSEVTVKETNMLIVIYNYFIFSHTWGVLGNTNFSLIPYSWLLLSLFHNIWWHDVICKLRFLEFTLGQTASLCSLFSPLYVPYSNLPFLSTVWLMAFPYFALKFLPNQLGPLPREIRIEKQVDRLVFSLYAWAFSGPSYA